MLLPAFGVLARRGGAEGAGMRFPGGLSLAAGEPGKSVRWVADQLGHRDPAFTLRTYAHATPSEDADLGFLDGLQAGSQKGNQEETKTRRGSS